MIDLIMASIYAFVRSFIRPFIQSFFSFIHTLVNFPPVAVLAFARQKGEKISRKKRRKSGKGVRTDFPELVAADPAKAAEVAEAAEEAEVA